MRARLAYSLAPVVALLAGNALAVDKEKSAPLFIEARGGSIVKTEPAPGGMTAYTVMKDGNLGVFFASPDKSVVMLGVMLDAKTGKNLSDQLLPADQRTEQPPVVANAEPSKIDSTRVIEHLKAADNAVKDSNTLAAHLLSNKVPGVTEGKGDKKTTFVFFDPLCPACHNLYDNTRTAVKNGKSVKWIPVNIRGDAGLPLSKQILREGTSALDALSSNRLKGIPMTSEERAQIDHNTALMYMLSEKMQMRFATPTLLFYNESNGKLRIAQDDGSNAEILKAAFGTN